MAKRKKQYDFNDSDADGLSDAQERDLGTNPKSQDTDGDGLGDYQEVNVYGTNPNNPDTDGDGIADGEEVKRGRNPLGRGKLRDLFIPHKGNNYHPSALHLKRVLFHAGSVIVVKTVVVLCILALPATAWLTPDVLLEQQQRVIQLTNVVRRNLGAPDLVENPFLNQAAFNKAQDMLIGQYFAHVSPSKKSLSSFLADTGYSYIVAGENLAMGFADAESVVNAWVKSPTHYANLIDADYKDIGVGMVSGPFNNSDTTLVAQYFGVGFGAPAAPLEHIPAVAAPQFSASANSEQPNPEQHLATETPVPSVPPHAPQTEKTPLPDPVVVAPVAPAPDERTLGVVENAPPIKEEPALPEPELLSEPEPAMEVLSIDESASKVYAAAADEDGGTAVWAEVRITGATSAMVTFNNNHIELFQDSTDPWLWTGSTIIFENDETQIFNPVVLPVLEARDASGATIIADISWDRIVPVKPSLTSQYFFIRQQDSGIIHSLVIVSSLYFKILLSFVVASLLLMIFIEIKKQHPKHIISGLGLIAVLVLAIML
ncbi:hypothetical protein BK004_02305 [bacterium CG10_46_32]|nr:MAG: hypothetical protein BK004_02305 [bacterium CG10_46_32]PIR56146.1 MAG: hypothetical protein COU73_02325 [Parcubacteria group bacterium CG10_big_fil_rev_8_21_14_0_10_46_32]